MAEQAIADLLAILDDRIAPNGMRVECSGGSLLLMWIVCNESPNFTYGLIC